jgi:exodeoxyribonuclease V alpha subunit
MRLTSIVSQMAGIAEPVANDSIALTSEQQTAIDNCCDLNRRCVAVTGAAGSGKTSLLREVARRLHDRRVPFAVAAPTGKAARRIRELTGICTRSVGADPQTVHKLLEFPRPDEHDHLGNPMNPLCPRRHRINPLEQRVVLVDEYAMVPWELHYAIVSAIRNGGCLRVFGDSAQLPPIEPDGFFREYSPSGMCESPFVRLLRQGPAHTLTQVHRNQTGILAAATRIRIGAFPSLDDSVRLHVTDRPLDTVVRVLDGLGDIDFSSLQAQVITPIRRGPVGTHALNAFLQSRYNTRSRTNTSLPRHKWAMRHPVRVGVGDKVVCTENSYDLRDWGDRYSDWKNGRPLAKSYIDSPETKQMLNGEIGVVVGTGGDGTVEIDFGDRVVEIPPIIEEFYARRGLVTPVDYRRNIDLAYALTTHKVQGSEFDHVVYVATRGMWRMLSRNNLYTGVTRARRSVAIVCDQYAMLQSLRKVAS